MLSEESEQIAIQAKNLYREKLQDKLEESDHGRICLY